MKGNVIKLYWLLLGSGSFFLILQEWNIYQTRVIQETRLIHETSLIHDKPTKEKNEPIQVLKSSFRLPPLNPTNASSTIQIKKNQHSKTNKRTSNIFRNQISFFGNGYAGDEEFHSAIVYTKSKFSSIPQVHIESSPNKKCIKLDYVHIESRYHRIKCLTRKEQQVILISLVHTLSELLETYDIPHWMDSGTLLGSIRSQTLIPWDKDVDFGLTEEGMNKLSKTRMNIPSTMVMEVLNSTIYKQGFRRKATPARLIHRQTGLFVDIFSYLPQIRNEIEMYGPIPSDCWWSCTVCPYGKNSEYKEYIVKKEVIFPLKKCMFEGKLVSCPNDTHTFLSKMYGKDYLTPEH